MSGSGYKRETASIEGIQSIRVSTSSTDVEMVQTEEDFLTAEFQAGSDDQDDPVELDMHRRGDVLDIRVIQKHQNFLFSIGNLGFNGFKKVSVVIFVPARVYEEIVVDGHSSDVYVRQLLAKSLSLTCRSGDIGLEDCMAKADARLMTSSGDIEARRLLVKEKLSVQATSGDIILKKLTAGDLQLQTSSGDIKVSDFRGTLQASSTSGDIDVQNDQLSGDIAAKASSGDIMIDFQEEPESLAVDFRGSSGDGRVKIKGMLYEEKSDHQIIGKKGDGQFRIKVRTSSGDFQLR